MTNLTVVIMALVDRGRLEIVKSIPLICIRKIKGSDSKCIDKLWRVSEFGLLLIPSVSSAEVNKNDYPLVLKHFSCNKDGFNITIPQNATVPPLNLDVVWIPSNQSNCKPQKRSKDAVTFSFPFTDCGTQSMVNVNNLPPLHNLRQVRWYFCD